MSRGGELKRVWTKMKLEEVQSATWLADQHRGAGQGAPKERAIQKRLILKSDKRKHITSQEEGSVRRQEDFPKRDIVYFRISIHL